MYVLAKIGVGLRLDSTDSIPFHSIPFHSRERASQSSFNFRAMKLNFHRAARAAGADVVGIPPGEELCGHDAGEASSREVEVGESCQGDQTNRREHGRDLPVHGSDAAHRPPREPEAQQEPRACFYGIRACFSGFEPACTGREPVINFRACFSGFEPVIKFFSLLLRFRACLNGIGAC